MGVPNIFANQNGPIPLSELDANFAAVSDFTSSYAGAVDRSIASKLQDIVSVKDFGAIGDGITNDGPAFVAALATGRQVYIPYTPTGYNVGTSVLIVGTGQYVVGENQVKLLSSSATACFLLQGYDIESGIRHVLIDMNGAPVGSTAIRFDTSVNVVWRVRIADVRIQNAYEAFGQASGPAYITDVIIQRITIILAKGRQINFTLSRGSFKWEKINLDNTISGSPLVTWTSANFVNYAGLELNEFDVAGQNAIMTQTYNANAIGINCDNTGAPAGTGFLWMRRVRIESSMGPGIIVKGNNFFYGDIVESFAALGHAITFLNCTIGMMSNVYGRGAKDQTGKSAGQNGVYLDTCTNFAGSNISADSNDGAGVLVANCSGVAYSAVRSSGNGTYGYLESGTNSGNSVVGAAFNSNTTAAVLAISANIVGAETGGTRLSDSAAFYAHKNGTDQTGIAPNTFTKVTFGTAPINLAGKYDTAQSRWTPPAGNYRISSTLNISAGVVAAAELTILIYKNGSSLYQSDFYPAAAAGTSINIVRPVIANGTDFFEVYVFLAGAGNKTVGGTIAQTSFEASPL